MKRIPLTQGKFALVSDEDFLKISGFSWSAQKHRDKWYARTGVRAGKRVEGIKMHRLIIGAEKGQLVDHRDLDGLNNQRSNLRVCGSAQNALNRVKQKGAFSSQFKGVSKREGQDVWRAAINIAGRRIRLGNFKIEIEAARAYDKAAVEHHGEFANINGV